MLQETKTHSNTTTREPVHALTSPHCSVQLTPNHCGGTLHQGREVGGGLHTLSE